MKAKGLMVGDLIKTKNNFSVDNELNNKYCKVHIKQLKEEGEK